MAQWLSGSLERSTQEETMKGQRKCLVRLCEGGPVEPKKEPINNLSLFEGSTWKHPPPPPFSEHQVSRPTHKGTNIHME